jgi:stress response protein YsnF
MPPRSLRSLMRNAMPEETAPPGEVVIPLVEETIALSKRVVETGQVRISLSTDVEQAILRETMRGRRVEVERVAVDRLLAEGEAPPQTREEGDTLIIPLVEETAVVVKRVVLREEVRLRFISTEVPFEEEVALRRQRATVERVPSADPASAPVPDTECNAKGTTP